MYSQSVNRPTLGSVELGPADCPSGGLIHRIDYDNDHVTIWVPRNCIGRPDWVKVSVWNSLLRGDSEFDQVALVDNPHSATADGPTTLLRLYRAAS